MQIDADNFITTVKATIGLFSIRLSKDKLTKESRATKQLRNIIQSLTKGSGMNMNGLFGEIGPKTTTR